MRVLKWIVLGVVALVVIILVAAGVILATFDPNDYKDTIISQVKEQTGRDLAIEGDLSLSLFPWLGAEIGPTSLSNAPGFGEAPFAQVEGVKVKVEVLPLLRREVSIDVIELDGMALNLARNAEGKGNWEDLAGAAEEPVAEEPAAPAAEPGEGPGLASLAVGGLSVRDASVVWEDNTAGTQVQLKDFNLTTDKIEPGKPFHLEISFNVENREPAMIVGVQLTSDITLDLEAQRYQLADLKVAVNAQGDTLPGGAMDADLGANVVADLKAQTAVLEALRLGAAGLEVVGEAQVDRLLDAPSAQGKLEVPLFDLRKLMADLEIALPETADPEVLTQASASMNFSGSPEAASLPSIQFQLDQSTLQGKMEVKNFEAPAVRFEFNLSELDADRYLPPPTESAEETAAPSSGDVPDTSAEDTPIELPVEMLRGLDVQGKFTAGKVKVMNLLTQDIEIGLKAAEGDLRIAPLKASLYQGGLDGSLGVDVRKDVPRFTINTKLAGVQAEPLLKDYMESDFISGVAAADTALTTSGQTVNGLKANLNGRLALSFKNGSLKTVNIAQMIRKAEAKLKGKSLDEAEATKGTDFSSLTVSGDIKNGVLDSQDLDLRSPLLRVGGAGQVDLTKDTLDYLAKVTVTGDLAGQGGKARSELKGLTIPIRAKGSFDDPQVKLELDKALGEKAKAELEQEKAKLKEKADAEKQKLEEQAKESIEAEKERAKEKLKEGLKKLF